jgi:hypothetical protein
MAKSPYPVPPPKEPPYRLNPWLEVPLREPTKDELAKFAKQAVAALEKDPLGMSANTPGAKLDSGKVRPSLVLGGFARALLAVSRIGTFGAAKYTDNGWMGVPNGEARYDDAKLRHWLYEKCGIEDDPESQEMHAAHEAWNALARLDLILRRKEKQATSGRLSDQ